MTSAGTEFTAKVVTASGKAAGTYDGNGVGFAGPIASRLVEHARLDDLFTGESQQLTSEAGGTLSSLLNLFHIAAHRIGRRQHIEH